MCSRDPLQCIIPPYIMERLVESDDPRVRAVAVQNLQESARIRGMRDLANIMAPPRLLQGVGARTGRARKSREVYDQGRSNPPHVGLPGRLRRREGDPPIGDAAVDEAYNFSGYTWDFYHSVMGRDSLDDAGMTMVSSVHAGKGFSNAFWNGAQMVYGDGDGAIFRRFTASLDVVGHELTHGVVQYTCGLVYQGEPGALNEHFADVFGSLVRQHRKKQDAAQADWLVGADLLFPAPTRRAIRSLQAPGTAFSGDPYLGTDPQPDHYSNRYRGSADNGGVHINSGIPNHAFYLAAIAIGGRAWEKAGKIWYQAMLSLQPSDDFHACAAACRRVAVGTHGAGSSEASAVDAAWGQVGL